MVEKVQFNSWFPSTKTKSQKSKPDLQLACLKNSEKDVFIKTDKKKDKASFITAFQGKVDQLTKKVGKGFFTKADNLYKNASDLLEKGLKENNQDMLFKVHGIFVSSMEYFEKSLVKLRAVLPENEYAEKANYVGVKYSQLGNLTRSKEYFSRAYELFDEAAGITNKYFYEEKQKAELINNNKETLFQILNPVPQKNQIGFVTAAQNDTAKTAMSQAKPHVQIGFRKQ